MTVQTAYNDALALIGLPKKAALFSFLDEGALQWQSIMNDCAKEICAQYDWPELEVPVSTVVSGSPVQTIAKPADFSRPHADSPVLVNDAPYTRTYSRADFYRFGAEVGSRYLYSASGFELSSPASVGATIKYFYISNVVATNGVNRKSSFTLDSDSFVLSDRLLTLCAIVRWKKLRGFPSETDEVEYASFMAKEIEARQGQFTAPTAQTRPQR